MSVCVCVRLSVCLSDVIVTVVVNSNSERGCLYFSQ